MGSKMFSDKRGSLFDRASLTNKLIFVNVAVFILSIILINYYGEEFILEYFALSPGDILSGEKIWGIFTSMFFHAGFFHLFANMFSLFFVGNFLEKIIGKKRFIAVYIISGLVGGLFFVISGLIFSDNTVGVGASGAIFGLLGVLAVLVPKSRIYLIVGPLIVLIFMVIFPSLILLWNIIILVMIFSMLSFNSKTRKFAVPLELPMWLLPIVAIVPLTIISFFVNLPIGNSAHIGGLLLGLVYGSYLMKRFPKKINILRRHFR